MMVSFLMVPPIVLQIETVVEEYVDTVPQGQKA